MMIIIQTMVMKVLIKIIWVGEMKVNTDNDNDKDNGVG